MADEDLRSMIEANLTCRVDHQYVSLVADLDSKLHAKVLNLASFHLIYIYNIVVLQ